MKKLLLTLILGLLLVSTVSAWEFDNVKQFDKGDSRYGTVELGNFFGLGKTLEIIKLKDNTDYCSENCYAIKEIELFEEGKIIDDIKFETIENNVRTEEPINSYKFYVAEVVGKKLVDDYENQITEIYYEKNNSYGKTTKRVNVGSHYEDVIEWKEFNLDEEFKIGNYTIKLEGKKDKDKSVDWIIKSQGIWIDDWTLWNGNTQPAFYWSFDDKTEEVYGKYNLIDNNGGGDFVTSDCLIGGCGNITDGAGWNLTDGPREFEFRNSSNASSTAAAITWNFWLKTREGAGAYIFSKHEGGPEKGYGIWSPTSATNASGMSYCLDSGAMNIPNTYVNEWIMYTIIVNESGVSAYVNGNYVAGGTADPSGGITNDTSINLMIGTSTAAENYNGSIDEWGIWNRTLTETEITELFNNGDGSPYAGMAISATLVSPVNYYNSSSVPVSLNISAEVTLGNNLVKNISLWTNSTGTWEQNQTYDASGLSAQYVSHVFNLTIPDDSSVLWGAYVCDNASLCEYSTENRTFTYDTSILIINSETYNTETIETAIEEFIINITYDTSVWNSVTAQLNYNNTNHSGSLIDSGNDILFDVNISIPQISGTTQNNSFYWIFSLTNSTGIKQVTSTSHEQTVSLIIFRICNDTETAFVRFTTKSATNPFPNLNATFKSSWDIKQEFGGNELIDSSYEDTGELNHTWDFCLVPPSKNYTISATIDVDAVGYSKNFHYLTNATYTNTTTNITLYLLNDSLATLVVLKAVDDSRQPIENVYISIQFYDVGTDTFYTIGMAKTDFNGEDLTYLNWYDSLYKFVLVKDGTTIKSTTPYKISSTPQIFEVKTVTDFIFDKFKDFEYNLTFNNDTKNFVLTFVKPSGEVEKGCLKVVKKNVTNDYTVCETCAESSSATLYCNIANWGNGTFIGIFYATGSPGWYIAVIEWYEGVRSDIYALIGNVDGTAMAIVFAGIVLSFFLISPALGVVGVLLGMGGAIALGFQTLDYLTLLGIIIIGGVVIWILKR